MCPLVGVLCEIFVSCLFIKEVRRDSLAGLATRYRLDGEWIEFPCGGWGREFPQLSRRALGPNQPPVQWVPRLYRG
jgi:hypothetical protein